MIDIAPRDLATLKRLLAEHFPQVEARAFGSRYHWTAKDYSDLDLALVGEQKLERPALHRLREALAESDLPFRVDVLDWQAISPEFQQVIEAGYEVIQEKGREERAEGWKTYKIINLAEKITKGTTPTTLGHSFIENGEVNFIKAESILMDGSIDTSKFAFIDRKTHDKLKRSQLQEDDILFSMAGMVLGKTGIVRKEFLPANTNQALAIIRLKKNLVLPQFIHYYMRQKSFFYYVNQSTGQSAQPNINLQEIGDLEIDLLPLPTQRRIADILSALDDKIELNRQTNATLEAIAQAIFKEWFVNFNFPGSTSLTTGGATGKMQDSELGPIPVGWRVGKVGELCEVNNNSISKNDQFDWIDYIEISQVSKGKIASVTRYSFGEEPSRAKRKLKQGDTVLSTVRPNRGSYFLALNPAETSIASTGFAVFSPTKVPFGFLYLLLTDSEKLEYYGHVADGAAYPAINPKLIMEMDIVIPEDCVLNDFHSVTEPIFYKMFFANQETETLAQIRDALLPKLMRGEIEV